MAQEEQVFNYKLQLSEKTKALEEMPHLTKRSRDFQQKNVELTTRVKVLTSELENVQNIAVEDRARSEYQLKNIKQLLVEQEAICKTLTGEKEAQKMKMQRMEDELYSVQKALENSRSEASQLSVSLTKTQSRHDEIIHQFKYDRDYIESSHMNRI